MKKIIEFPDRKVIEQEALDWLIKLDGDEPLTQQELNDLTDWLARSPVHREEINSLNDFWQNNVLTELMVPLACASHHGNSGRLSFLQYWFNQRWQYSVSAAAIVLSFTLLLSTMFSANEMGETNGLYLTGIGKLSHTELADGTVMHLNTDSQVEVVFADDYRNIRILRGEAHFEVAKNREYPFRVYAGDGRIEAVGTAFSVYFNQQEVDILVTEGRVAVATLNKEQAGSPHENNNSAIVINKETMDDFSNSFPVSLGHLDAGQRVLADLSDKSLQRLENVKQISNNELKRQLSWQQGLLNFSGESLEHVVAEVSRFTTIEIEIIDQKLKSLSIGGRFKAGEVEAFLLVLESNFGVQVKRVSYNKVQLSLPDK